MLFSKQTKQTKQILIKENIVISWDNFSVESAINKVGDLLVKSNYVNQAYVDAMHKRNTSLSVFLGNYLAVPHGEFEAKQHILHSGISVLFLPNGMDWQGNKVHFVVGLAGKGEEHMEILSNIAEVFQEEENVLSLVKNQSIDEIYKIFSKGDLQ